ncbi:MAG: hypothetical protein RRY15_08110 [Bacteroidales bacterium]
MQDLISLLNNIDSKVHTFSEHFLALKHQNQILNAKIQEQVIIIENNNQKIIKLENENSILKIGGSVNTTGKNSTQAKQAINELVREIDKCIKLLDS